MSSSDVPLIAAMPQFGGGANTNALAASSPSLQALLQSVGGPSGFQNINSLAASNPAFASMLSMMQPSGGLNPQQAAQFGPIFGLLMGLQGQNGIPPSGT